MAAPTSLELQALGPIQAPTEMDQSLAGLVGTLSAIPGYATLFAARVPTPTDHAEHRRQAIATYERTVVSASSPFDAWIDGDEHAIPAAAKRGFDLFNTKGGCASCHGGWTSPMTGFHDTGLPDDDLGRGRLFPHVLKMQHAFKTPGLRETARRGPYMHDGSLPTLAAVVAHYNQGGVDRPSRSELIGPLGLSADEQADLVAFLQTLTSAVRLGRRSRAAALNVFRGAPCAPTHLVAIAVLALLSPAGWGPRPASSTRKAGCSRWRR